MTTRKNLLDISHSSKFVKDWLEVFELASATDSVLLEAIDTIESHKLSFWDAMLLTTARRSGCSALLSEDLQDGWRLKGLEIINPFAADALARLQDFIKTTFNNELLLEQGSVIGFKRCNPQH